GPGPRAGPASRRPLYLRAHAGTAPRAHRTAGRAGRRRRRGPAARGPGRRPGLHRPGRQRGRGQDRPAAVGRPGLPAGRDRVRLPGPAGRDRRAGAVPSPGRPADRGGAVLPVPRRAAGPGSRAGRAVRRGAPRTRRGRGRRARRLRRARRAGPRALPRSPVRRHPDELRHVRVPDRAARLRAPGRRATAPPRSPARPRAWLRLATVDPYLLGLRLEGRRVLVVGGGGVASRRVPALLDAGAEVLLVSPKVAASLEDLAAAGRIRWAARGYQARDCAGAWLVCACNDDPGVNAAVAAEAEAQRTWYVRADDAAESAAWTPASGRAGDVRVGVLSVDPERTDPRHSAAIRDAVVAGLQSGRISARHGRGRRGGVAIIGGGP